MSARHILVPLPLVILGRKRVPPEGIFWMSVLAGTGQPADLDKPIADQGASS